MTETREIDKWQRWTLVDAPVTPYDSLAARRAWLAEIRRRVEADPDDGGLRAALEEAERLVAHGE